MLHWNADPTAFSLGPVTVRWYGIFFAVAFWQGLIFMRRAYARAGYDPGEADRLFGYIVIGVVVGARLGHCLIYEPAFYLSRPLEILKVWEGGLASHGGAAGLVFGVWLFFKRSGRADPFWLLDRLGIPAVLGGMCIRLGNFMNSEIVGLPTAVPWAVIFERVDSLPRHPAQLYEALAYGVTALLLGAVSGSEAGRRKGVLAGWCLILVFGFRVVLEFFKTPQAAYEADFTLTVGQWLSVPVILAGCWLVRRRPA